MDRYFEKRREIPIADDHFDLIVVGAGLAGISAAVTAGRKGVKTLLVERSGILGGVATASLMSSATNFFFNTKTQVIKGIAEEIFENLAEVNGTTRHWLNAGIPQIAYDNEKMQNLLYQMLKKAGVKTLLYSLVTDVVDDESQGSSRKNIKGIIVENKSGRQVIMGKYFVDCTGDADIAFRIGASYSYSKPDRSTVMFEMGNVDLNETYNYYKLNQDDFDSEADVSKTFSEFEKNWIDYGVFHTPHNGGGKNRILQQAIKNGDYFKKKGLAEDLDAFGLYGIKGTKKVLVNSNFFPVDPINNIEDLSKAKLEGIECCVMLGELLTKIMPGFKDSFITKIASDIGVRLTRIVQCDYTITEKDFFSCKEFEDVVCYMPSMIRKGRGVIVTDGVFGFPYRALIPTGINNLLIGSGKSISADFMVIKKFFRSQINTMAIGESAGKAAAVAVQEEKNIRDIDVKYLR